MRATAKIIEFDGKVITIEGFFEHLWNIIIMYAEIPMTS